MKRSYKGFTLIELLVVIAIIGLLSTLAVVALNSARQRSRDAKRVADIRQTQTALELGFSETSAYPTLATALGSSTSTVLCKDATVNPAVPKWQANTAACGAGTTIYMGLVPSNPSPAAAGGSTYVYTPNGASGYSILFWLEGATGQLSAGGNCANQNGITAGSAC